MAFWPIFITLKQGKYYHQRRTPAPGKFWIFWLKTLTLEVLLCRGSVRVLAVTIEQLPLHCTHGCLMTGITSSPCLQLGQIILEIVDDDGEKTKMASPAAHRNTSVFGGVSHVGSPT